MSNRLQPLLLLLAICFCPPAPAASDPLLLVQQTSDRVLLEILNRKDELTASPGKIYALIDDILIPRFDFHRMSRLVLGKYWRRAEDYQKAAFVRQFRELLVRTYATALLNYSGQEIKYLPVRLVPGAKQVVVKSEVREGKGTPVIPIKYSLYLGEDDWLVYDVTIDGVSLVSNYRSSFAAQVRRYRLDGLIERLMVHNQRDR